MPKRWILVSPRPTSTQDKTVRTSRPLRQLAVLMCAPPKLADMSPKVRNSRRAQPHSTSAQFLSPKLTQKYVAKFSKELNSLRALWNICLETQQWQLQDSALKSWPRLGLLRKLAISPLKRLFYMTKWERATGSLHKKVLAAITDRILPWV